MGAMGAALATMVANLSSHKRGWDDRWEEFSDWADKGKALHDELLKLIDEDTKAFNAVMEAFGLPGTTDDEKAARTEAIENATKYAIEIPFRVMQVAYASMAVSRAMAETGNPNSISDAGVGAIAARSGVLGAYLNVKINAPGIQDRPWIEDILERGRELQSKAMEEEQRILKVVNEAL
jgi:glutamate formiminotransferase/formiminotetrahydrofolate cyclodeaminase